MGRCATCRASTQNFCFVHQEFVCSTCLVHHPSGLHATCAVATYRNFVQDSSYPLVPLCVSCNQPFRSPPDAVRRLCLHLECVSCITNPTRKPDIKCAKCALPLLPPDAPPSALQEAIRSHFAPSPINISLQADLSATMAPPPQPRAKLHVKTGMRALPTSPVAATPSPPPLTPTAPQLYVPGPASHTISTTDPPSSAVPPHAGAPTVLHSRPPPQIVPFRVTGSGYALGASKSGQKSARGSADWLPSTTSATTSVAATSPATAPGLTVTGIVAGLVAALLAFVEPQMQRVVAAVAAARRQAPQLRARAGRSFEHVARATRRLGKEAGRRLRAARKSPGQAVRARRSAMSAVCVVCVVLVMLLSSGDDTRPAAAGHGELATGRRQQHKRVPAAAADAVPLALGKESVRQQAGRVAVRPHVEAEESDAEDEVVRLPHVHVGRAFNRRGRW